MKALQIIIEITKDILRNIAYFMQNNLRVFAMLLDLILPYMMYFVGLYGYAEGYELLVPLAYFIVIHYLRSASDKIGKGTTIPIPLERFTSVDEDGEVTIETRRTQELILYVADVEDWLERKGLL